MVTVTVEVEGAGFSVEIKETSGVRTRDADKFSSRLSDIIEETAAQAVSRARASVDRAQHRGE